MGTGEGMPHRMAAAACALVCAVAGAYSRPAAAYSWRAVAVGERTGYIWGVGVAVPPSWGWRELGHRADRASVGVATGAATAVAGVGTA